MRCHWWCMYSGLMVMCKAEAEEVGASVARGGWGIVRARVTHNHVQ
jgi:hypothetical protein